MNEINIFMLKNEGNINKVIKDIINDYERDDQLEWLENPMTDLIDEYLYKLVNTRE